MAKKRKHDHDVLPVHSSPQPAVHAHLQQPQPLYPAERPTLSTVNESHADDSNVATPGAEGSTPHKKPRIGRACDRCQIRKLRCGAELDGCQHCLQANEWCTSTDPVSGKRYYRGEIEYLQRRVAQQNKNIRELAARLRALGEDTAGLEDTKDVGTRKYEAWLSELAPGDAQKLWDRAARQRRASDQTRDSREATIKAEDDRNMAAPTRQDSLYLPVDDERDSANGTLSLPDVRTGIAQRSYMGVTHGANLSGPNPGFRLNLLGWHIDLASFIGDTDSLQFGPLPTFENPVYNRSYRSFIATAYGHQPKVARPDLPPKEAAFYYANMILHGHNAYMPILHGPSFIDTLARVYDEPGFKPSDATDVSIHIVLAIALYNLSLRSPVPPPKESAGASLLHYHYAIGFFPTLLAENTLEAMQALTMISNHVREFPLPELGYYVASNTFNRLVTLSYHRSASSGQPWAAAADPFEIEMRKRVFWSAMLILVPNAGRLGRPMPIRYKDFDVEVPVNAIDQPVVAAGDPAQSPGYCSFKVAHEAFKVVLIFMEMYHFLYAARKSPDDYMDFVRKAETQIAEWVENWDPIFQDSRQDKSGAATTNVNMLRYYAEEFRLVLFHPSLSLTKSVEFNESNLRKCLDATDEMLRTAMTIKELHVTSGTWDNCAAYLLAMQTTIYGHSHFRAELTQDKMRKLKADMDSWLEILGEVGRLVGSGPELKNTVKRLVRKGLSQLEQYLNRNTSFSKPKSEPLDNAEHAVDPQHQRGNTSAPAAYDASMNAYGPHQNSVGSLAQSPSLQHETQPATIPYRRAESIQDIPSASSYVNYPQPIQYAYQAQQQYSQPQPAVHPSPSGTYGPVQSDPSYTANSTNHSGAGAARMGSQALSPPNITSYHSHQASHSHHTIHTSASGTPEAAAPGIGSPMDARALNPAADAESWHQYIQQWQQQPQLGPHAPEAALMQPVGGAGGPSTAMVTGEAAIEYADAQSGPQALQEMPMTWLGNMWTTDPRSGAQ